ncbi:MAG: SPOR domain-containing protein [Sulfitobacter sp.]
MYPDGSEAEMAVYDSSHDGGDFVPSSGIDAALTSGVNRLQGLTNAAGAVVSLALIAGIGIWGYKLLVRDVSGIPVVRAAAGEMRVLPEDPGGELAQNQGLSVNAVAAVGSAAAPADQLRLAPKAVDLEDEDQVTPAAMVAPAPQVVTSAPNVRETIEAAQTDVAAALQSGNVDALVEQLTQGVEPLSDLAETPDDVVDDVVAAVTESVVAAVTEAEESIVTAVVEGPGVRQSLRPRKRPAQQAKVINASLTSSTTKPQTASVELDAASLPAGTRLAQLGAFDSEVVAREQWDQLQGRFSDYLADKKRIIQKASSGGRVFYRLRALGFEDIADARRFCSALVAENADCIPVVTR